jgi:hypothetical protein
MTEEVTQFKERLILTSHSIDNVFDGCARKFEFLALYDKRPTRESGYAAQVGTALHDGTQAWLMARADGLSEKKSVERGFMAFAKAFPWDDEYEQTQSIRSFGICCEMLYAIIRHPSWDDWELVRVAGHGWAIEVPFLIKHVSLGPVRIKNAGVEAILATQGKIDFILKHRTIPNLYRTRDLKTTIYDSDLVLPEYWFSGQQVGYSNTLHAMLGEMKKDFEVDYLVAHFMGSDGAPVVEEVTIPMDQDKVDDYWMTKQDRLLRMRAYAEHGWFPRSNGKCHAWGRPCTFFPICPTRDYDMINMWFDGINAEPQAGYDYWVTIEV